MNKKSVTIKDIANEAGVSTATVSRVISGKTVPGNLTERKVLDAASSLGYVFKPKGHYSSKKVIIAVIHNKNVGYLDTVLDGVQQSAYELGYSVIVHILRNEDFDANYFINLAIQFSASGILFVSACVSSSIMKKIESRIPVVKCIDLQDEDEISCIGIDEREAGRKITSYLISTGRKRIAFMTRKLKGKVNILREEGYREAMAANGLTVHPNWVSSIIQGESGPSEIVDLNQVMFFINTLLNMDERPDAIVCIIDTDAAMVQKALLTLGIRVPEDMAVTGFYNLQLSRLLVPDLTSYETHAANIGFGAMKILDERINNPSLPQTKIVTAAEIIIRGSTSVY